MPEGVHVVVGLSPKRERSELQREPQALVLTTFLPGTGLWASH